jgi:putative redox protein
VAERLEVTATWRGGYAATVDARGHVIEVDEPESAGGGNAGAMPTELLCASLASCFCLALGHVARKRDLELPQLRVTVQAERAGKELRYERLVVIAEADVPARDLERLLERARAFCWVSNTLAGGVELEYRSFNTRQLS